MSDHSVSSNPFFGLFNDNEVVEREEVVPSCSQSKSITGVNEPDDSAGQTDPPVSQLSALVNKLAEDVFRLTITKDNLSISAGRVPQLVFLEDVAATVTPGSPMNLETLKLAIFERLLLDDPSQSIITITTKVKLLSNSHAVQRECLLYLFECYKRLKTSDVCKEVIEQVVSYVVENAATALRQPCLFESQNVHKQIIDLFEIEESHIGLLTNFLVDICTIILSEDDSLSLGQAFQPTLILMHRDFANATVMTFPRIHFSIMSAFASIPCLATILVDYMMPKDLSKGLSYADTLLGAMLNLSCLPKSVEAPVEYFEKPLEGALSALEGNLWRGINELCDRVHGLVEQLMRGEGRPNLLLWISKCLDSNLPRGRLWATTNLGLPGAVGFISDGFSINFAAVLLRLCRPFIQNDMDSRRRLLKIDPTFSTAPGNTLSEETCLQPCEEAEERYIAQTEFSFMTQVFHLTHRALDLSVRVLLERTQQLYQEIGRLQMTLNDAQSQSIPPPHVIDAFTERMEMEMSRYLCMRCALLEPSLLELLGKMEVATAVWVVQLLVDPTSDEGPHPKLTYAPLTLRPLTFPLPQHTPFTFKCVPELVVESVGRYLRLTKTYSSQSLEEGGSALLEPLLSVLLVLMSSNTRARNPHLRAGLAQCLECLLPRDQEQPSLNPNPLGVFYREKLFIDHPHRQQIVECLLSVFVSIEMTGQSVAFEQKFNYRRPMYTVMDYLWGIPEHRQIFKQLSTDAEANMEEVTPPLFLRFLNLLMNDAVFLLDEALTNMAQIRNLQTARDNGEWRQLSSEERDRNEQYFRQVGMTARFDNILGKETIHTLEYMSSETKSIFCHSTMVDRIAAMLNYFLFHLVGPKKKNFKVKDQTEYKFDPGGVVLDICRIYVHLGSSDLFCAAVSRDGRSYSPQLFSDAKDVLARIGGLELLTELDRVADRVGQLATLQHTDEELLAEAPEEFLDPIMSTLMSDPVILPSSRITLDRSTIARHLLSDQTDPFNRSPLTMNLVQSNVELKKAIEAWVAERRSSASPPSTSASPPSPSISPPSHSFSSLDSEDR